MDPILQIGMGGVLAILLIREVISFIKWLIDRREPNGDGKPYKSNGGMACQECRSWLMRTHELTEQLFTMHNQKDADGVYVWYVKHSLTEAINKIADAITLQTQLLQKIVEHQDTEDNEKKLASLATKQ